jgi:hypothetical protein
MDGADDLAAIDALQIDAGDPKIGVPKLTLDHDERNAFVRHLDRMSVTQLVAPGRRLPDQTKAPSAAQQAPSDAPPCANSASLADAAAWATNQHSPSRADVRLVVGAQGKSDLHGAMGGGFTD